MIDKGLIKEVEDLLNKKQMSTGKSSMKSVGYKQVSDYLKVIYPLMR